jgi:putative peptidoglycan lipid II flippase
MLLAEPIARLLFQYGKFGPDDAVRTARTIAWFATGVWAYCATPVLARGFYSLGDRISPVRVAVWMVGLNLFLNLTLIWPMAEAGLAASTSIAAVVQTFWLAMLFSRRHLALEWRPLGLTTVRTILASTVMAGTIFLVLGYFPEMKGLTGRIVEVVAPVVAGAAAYLVTFRLLGGREFSMLFAGKNA